MRESEVLQPRQTASRASVTSAERPSQGLKWGSAVSAGSRGSSSDVATLGSRWRYSTSTLNYSANQQNCWNTQITLNSIRPGVTGDFVRVFLDFSRSWVLSNKYNRGTSHTHPPLVLTCSMQSTSSTWGTNHISPNTQYQHWQYNWKSVHIPL